MPLARAMLLKQEVSAEQLVFVDDDPRTQDLNGHPVLTYQDFTGHQASNKVAALAIADSKIRESLHARLNEDGIKLWSVKADNVVTMDDIHLNEGCLLSPFVCLTSNIKIGCCFHANLYSYVEHDCVIGDYVTFAPGVKCNGNVRIEDHVYIGAGAIIRQGKPDQPLVIGKGAIVGMGAVVTRDVPAGTTVVGNPAKAIRG
jgi:sugar O-acyltransferase (sialic acid O-acetyltransferase NeuD family)